MKQLTRRWAWGAFIGLLLLHGAVNIWWLAEDNHPIRTDEETHMLFAREYYSALFPGDCSSLTSRIGALLRIEPGHPAHPPLLHVLGALVIYVLGYSVDALAFTATLIFIAALAGCYMLARRFLADGEALYGVAAVSFTPLVYTASRYFMTDLLSMALFIWALFALLQSRFLTRTRWCLLFGVLNGLALLARTNTPLYYFFPLLLLCGVAPFYCLGSSAYRVRRCGKLLLNLCLIITLTLLISGPWYLLHGDRFLTYWFIEHRAGSGGPLSFVQVIDDNTPAKEKKESDTPAVSREDNSAKPNIATDIRKSEKESRLKLGFIPRRTVPLMRYPVFIINQGLFLPSFILAMAGLMLFVLSRRFRRSGTVWMVLVSIAGAYIGLTCFLDFATPRYTLQILPLLMLFAVLPFFMISHGPLRHLAQGLFLLLLLFQYGNLTFRDYGRCREVRLPLFPDPYMQQEYDDAGLYFFRSQLTLGFSFSGLGAPQHSNYKERLFDAMAQAEKRCALWGDEAYYIRLNMRGMALEEQHYWPESHQATPFSLPGLAEEKGLWRRFQQYGWGKTVEDIQPFLAQAHYVVYSTEGIDEAEETRWRQVLESQGFSLETRFKVERMGRMPAFHLAVLARAPASQTVEALFSSEHAGLSLYDAYRYRLTPQYLTLPREQQIEADNRLAEYIHTEDSSLFINNYLSFVQASVIHDLGDWYVFRFLFHIKKSPDRNWRFYFTGCPVQDSDASSDETPCIEWNFDPAPATRFWPKNDYLLITHRVQASAMPHMLQLGLFSRQDGFWGKALDFGIVDFNAIPRRDETSLPVWRDSPWDESQGVHLHNAATRFRFQWPPEIQFVKRRASPAMRALLKTAVQKAQSLVSSPP